MFLASFSTRYVYHENINKRCSPSLTINSTFKCKLEMYLHGIYIFMTIIFQFLKPIGSHPNVI